VKKKKVCEWKESEFEEESEVGRERVRRREKGVRIKE
jgi:hypothetical protein